jgi:hypothetical protein
MRLLPLPKGNEEFHRLVYLWRSVLDQLIYDALSISTVDEAVRARAEALEYFLIEEEDLAAVCEYACVEPSWVMNSIKFLQREDHYEIGLT